MRRIFQGMVVLLLVALLAQPSLVSAATWPTERVGSSGPNVFTIQHLLIARGYSLTADGIFGSGTESAVKSFQASQGMAADGIVGPGTWPVLVITVQSGSTGEAVKGAQRQLNKYGYNLAVDGAFGPGTDAAARDFQRTHGLTADGVIGSNTWLQLTSGGSSRAQLAAQIRDSNRITLVTVHPSGNVDSATARQNIVDTANGLAAQRSSYCTTDGCGPGGSVSLDTNMLGSMLNIANTYTFQVTEVAGGVHSANSRHYAGVAFDVNTINGVQVNASNPYFQAFMQRCRDLGATEVLGPGDSGHSTHVHCAWPRP